MNICSSFEANTKRRSLQEHFKGRSLLVFVHIGFTYLLQVKTKSDSYYYFLLNNSFLLDLSS